MKGGDIRQVFDPIMVENVNSLEFLRNPENNDQVLLFSDDTSRDGFAIQRTRIRLANVGNDSKYSEAYVGQNIQYYSIPFAGNPLTIRSRDDATFQSPNHRVFIFTPSGNRTRPLFSEAVRRDEPGAGVSGLHGQAGSERDIYNVRALTVAQFQTMLNELFPPAPAAAPAARPAAAAPVAATGKYVKMVELSNNSELSEDILDEIRIGEVVKMYRPDGRGAKAVVDSIDAQEGTDDVIVSFSTPNGYFFTTKISRTPGAGIKFVTAKNGVYLVDSGIPPVSARGGRTKRSKVKSKRERKPTLK